MIVINAQHHKGSLSRRKAYDIWFRKMEPVLISKRKMTEEDKERLDTISRKSRKMSDNTIK